ncbi:MAG: hypothetical protein AB3K77_05785 [Methanosarcinaceae archaeon]
MLRKCERQVRDTINAALFPISEPKVLTLLFYLPSAYLYDENMIVIKCARCKTKIFKYLKVGKGKVLRCFEERIVEDSSLREEGQLKCPKCGNLIGVEEEKWVKMNRSGFTYSGKVIKK